MNKTDYSCNIAPHASDVIALGAATLLAGIAGLAGLIAVIVKS